RPVEVDDVLLLRVVQQGRRRRQVRAEPVDRARAVDGVEGRALRQADDRQVDARQVGGAAREGEEVVAGAARRILPTPPAVDRGQGGDDRGRAGGRVVGGVGRVRVDHVQLLADGDVRQTVG